MKAFNGRQGASHALLPSDAGLQSYFEHLAPTLLGEGSFSLEHGGLAFDARARS